MNKYIITLLVALSVVLSFTAVSTASVDNLAYTHQRVEGVLKSQNLFVGNDGKRYLVCDFPRESGLYIGQEVVVQGFVWGEQAHHIRIDHIQVTY